MPEGVHIEVLVPILHKVGLLWTIRMSFLETQPYIPCCSLVAMMPFFALKATQPGSHQSHELNGFSTAKNLSARSTILTRTSANSDRDLSQQCLWLHHGYEWRWKHWNCESDWIKRQKSRCINKLIRNWTTWANGISYFLEWNNGRTCILDCSWYLRHISWW